MSHNYGIHGKSGSPDDLIADHRCCIFPEISPENGIVSAEIFCPEFYLIFSHSFQNAPCNFNDTGCYCYQCGSGNLHSWHSEQSIDQHCIEKIFTTTLVALIMLLFAALPLFFRMQRYICEIPVSR